MDRDLGWLMLYGAVYIRLKRPGFANHEDRRYRGRAIMLPGITGLRQVKQALQLEG